MYELWTGFWLVTGFISLFYIQYVTTLHDSLSLHCPEWLCPLYSGEMARWVIRLRVPANFFQDPPSFWVHSFGYWWYPTTRSQSPYRFSSIWQFSPTDASLGISRWSAMASISSESDSKSVASLSPDWFPRWPPLVHNLSLSWSPSWLLLLFLPGSHFS